jgi:cytochrome P450
MSSSGSNHAGTVLDPTRGPSVEDMRWLKSYPDVIEAFRSRDVVQGGGGQRDSHPFIGDSILALYGDAYFQRRRIVSSLFRRSTFKRLNDEVMMPAFAAALGACPRGQDGARRGELQTLVREVLCKVSAALAGIDGLEDSQMLARYLDLTEELALPVNMEWVTKDHRLVTTEGLEAKRAFEAEFFAPSLERRRQRLLSAGGEGSRAPAVDLMTLILQNPEHFERWDADLPLREILLFNDGVFGIINGVIHTVGELIEWFAEHPEHRALTEEREFLRKAVVEALRLHPASPFLIRRAIQILRLPSGLELAAGEYVVLDLVSASRDPEVFGEDQHRFDPDRQPRHKIKPTGLAFGDGPHTCIGVTLSMGEMATPDRNEESPPGLLIALVREFFRAGGELDPDRPPRWRAFNIRKEYSEFPVRFRE